MTCASRRHPDAASFPARIRLRAGAPRCAGRSAALDPALVAQLGAEDSDLRVEAIRKLVATEDPRVIGILQGTRRRRARADRQRQACRHRVRRPADAMPPPAQPPAPHPPNLDTVVINNRIRGELGAALAALRLGSTDRAERLAAAKELQGSDNEDALPIIERAMAKEADPEIKGILALAGASLALKSSEPELRAQCRAGAFRHRRPAGAAAARHDADARRRTAAIPRPTRACAQPHRPRSPRSTRGCARPRSAWRCSPGSASARSCCWPRSAWRSPTA